MKEGNPHILVVDDEKHQLETVCRGLFLYGYRCVGAIDVAGALELVDDSGGADFDLVLTDLTMPGSTGLYLIEQLRQRRPELPVIVITGLAASEEVEQVRELGIPLLQKPFEPDTLDQAIRTALASR